MTLAQSPPGAQAPGSGWEGGGNPLGAWLTRLCVLSPTLERRAEAARGGTVVYESCGVRFRSAAGAFFREEDHSRELPYPALFAAVRSLRISHRTTAPTNMTCGDSLTCAYRLVCTGLCLPKARVRVPSPSTCNDTCEAGG